MRHMKLERELFYRLIDRYNGNKEYFDHYVYIGNSLLMIIQWLDSWSYKVIEIETEELQ